ncbi:MAG: phosphate acetyltransferase [Candidatus Omnitrophica bacterium]|nr:phosphate acetyltransferase [Candidatus Omnitrophota bacterium]
MEILKDIYEKAKTKTRRIILPESLDDRVLSAAKIAADEQLAEIILVGSNEEIEKKAESRGLDISKVKIINHLKSKEFDFYAQEYFKSRKHRGVTISRAKEVMSNSLFYGAMMLKHGRADGFVAGAANTSGDVARAAIHCVGALPEFRTVSSSFIMIVPNCALGAKGLFIFADCAIIPSPSPEQLACIAISTADLMNKVFNIEPRVAMLSYSTKSSAMGKLIDKVAFAVSLIKKQRPDIMIDGELQVDAAIVPEVAQIKAPLSPIAGQANVLIFPDLESGNISYKLVQRLAGAKAIGPLLQGLNKPCSDLSRGCTVEDIIGSIAITALRVQ